MMILNTTVSETVSLFQNAALNVLENILQFSFDNLSSNNSSVSLTQHVFEVLFLTPIQAKCLHITRQIDQLVAFLQSGGCQVIKLLYY